MSISSGSHVGPYLVGQRVAAGDSGERYDASEASLSRPVSVLAAPLPADEASASALRERAHRLAALADARLLPVYGQGEEESALWLATRWLSGPSLAEIGELDPRRAARIGAQVAGQLTALQEAGLAPSTLAAADIVLEGEGNDERAWVFPNPLRPVGDDAAGATHSLLALLDERAGEALLTDRPSDPEAVAAGLAEIGRRRSHTRLVVLAGVVVACVVAAALAVVLGHHGSLKAAATQSAPIARVIARIPLGAAPGALSASVGSIWVSTGDGSLIHVDTKTNAVVGAPLQLFPKKSYVALAQDGDSVWAGGTQKIVRVDRSEKIVETKELSSRASVSGLLQRPDGLVATINDGPGPAARMVVFTSGKEVTLAPAFDFYPIPVLARGSTVWALGGSGGFFRIAGHSPPIGIGMAGQAGFPTVYRGRVWIPTRADGDVAVVDPVHMAQVGILRTGGSPEIATAGAGSIWVLVENPNRIYRIDPATIRIEGKPLAAPAGSRLLEYADNSLWVDDPKSKTLVRLAPTAPAPPLQPAAPVTSALQNGPLPVGARRHIQVAETSFSIEAPDNGWNVEGIGTGGFALESIHNHGHGMVVYAPNRVFGKGGRLVLVDSAADFVRALRKNPALTLTTATPITLDGIKGLRVRIDSHPQPPYAPYCPDACTSVFPTTRGTFVLTREIAEFTFVKHGARLFLVAAEFGPSVPPDLVRRIHALETSIRFDS